MDPGRLPRHLYQGERTCAFTACTRERSVIFDRDEHVEPCIEYLRRSADESGCLVPIYCFMPDHVHIMFKGQNELSDALAAMSKFKLLSGLWMCRKRLAGWQKNFYDHGVRGHDDWRNHVRYIANNPVRRGLAREVLDYRYTGSIGCELLESGVRSPDQARVPTSPRKLSKYFCGVA